MTETGKWIVSIGFSLIGMGFTQSILAHFPMGIIFGAGVFCFALMRVLVEGK